MPMKKEKEREITFNKRDLSRTVTRNMRNMRESVVKRNIRESCIASTYIYVGPSGGHEELTKQSNDLKPTATHERELRIAIFYLHNRKRG